MGTDTQKAAPKTASLIITKEDEQVAKFDEKEAMRTRSINVVLVVDPEGPIKKAIPTMRDPETHKMTYADVRYRPERVPPTQVLRFNGTPVRDFNSEHSATVDVQGKRTIVVFDRTYDYAGNHFDRCALVMDRIVLSGLLFEKKIDPRSHRPIAVRRRLDANPNSADRTMKYDCIGAKEAELRDLKRIYERIFISQGGPINTRDDDELNKFMYDAIAPIEQEVAT